MGSTERLSDVTAYTTVLLSAPASFKGRFLMRNEEIEALLEGESY